MLVTMTPNQVEALLEDRIRNYRKYHGRIQR
jgi:hypothetical protein